MKRRTIETIILAIACLVQAWQLLGAAEVEEWKRPGIHSIGIYNCYTGMPAEAIPFFKACGYNTYQRWDQGFARWPEHHAGYYAEVRQDILRMQNAGFRVYVILSINMRQRQAGEAETYTYPLFDPTDKSLMQDRLRYITAAVRDLKMADGFTIFAGDPGGHRESTPTHLVSAVKDIISIIAKEAPEAKVNINTWGIAAWDHDPSPFSVTFWEKEVQLTRDLLARPEIIGPSVSMEFPMHNYYRSLALKCYVDEGKQPELLPSQAEVDALRKRGVERIWGWPYFLTDECDDGYSPGTAGLAQSETRYLKRVIDTARQLGLDGMVADVFRENILSESVNLYAFARFCREPSVTCEQVIRDFAGFIAEPETANDLAATIRYVENRSTWQAGMPEKFRLANFDTATIQSVRQARDRLSKVVARRESPLPLMGSPATYVQKLRDRVELLISKDDPR
jgi:hypothetical protein